MVDPDGKEICLVYDNKSKSCTQQYKSRMDAEQFKDNKDLYNFVLGLNKLATIDVGATVIATLIKSPERYIFSDQRSPQGAYAFGGTTRTFYMGGLGSEEMDIDDMMRVGHELFHAYQKDKLGSEFGSGIDIEVEGYLYGYFIQDRLSNNKTTSIRDYKGGNDIDKGVAYNREINTLLEAFHKKQSFPVKDFNDAVGLFKMGSKQMGSYANFKEFTYTLTRPPVITTFYKNVRK
ncbi:MAG: hypothetical protein JNN12_02305 [Bacteroidetes Order II. Incertae sedis bacterium]|nr:hypothetical protein [Bacteroidetes Order II. bacterium]